MKRDYPNEIFQTLKKLDVITFCWEIQSKISTLFDEKKNRHELSYHF